MSIVPDDDGYEASLHDLIEAKTRVVADYVDRGWKVFVLGQDKTPLPLCGHCRNQDWSHDRERCLCLTCHGFYAATDDLGKLRNMCRIHPHGWLAVRTGRASKLLVLDFEASSVDDGPSGLDVLDEWFQWTGFDLPPTLRQRTQSGGLHLLYALPHGVEVKGKNRVLPQTDVKAGGGYVALPTPGRDTRHWATGQSENVAPAPVALLDWLARTRGGYGGGTGAGNGRSGGRVIGYDYADALKNGCPGGARDEFFNDLLFRMRKENVDRVEARARAREQWSRCAQPPNAQWFMPFEHVEYKIERIWQTVAPVELPSWRPTTRDDGVEKKTDVHSGIVRRENDWRSRA